MSSAICFNLDQSKILSSGNGLYSAFVFLYDMNPLQSDKILDQYKFKPFAGKMINTAQKFKFVLEGQINCMVFNAIFNSISVTSWQPVHLSMLSWSSFNQYSTFFPRHMQLSHITIVETTDSGGKGRKKDVKRRKCCLPEFLLFPQCF